MKLKLNLEEEAEKAEGLNLVSVRFAYVIRVNVIRRDLEELRDLREKLPVGRDQQDY